MITFSKTGDRSNFLFDKLSSYFKENDSYQGTNVPGYEGDGIVERFLETFCLELDNEFSPYIDALGYLFDATGLGNIPGTNPDRFLIHIADSWGNPPSISDNGGYKLLLRYLIYILRKRGTLEGLNLYLRLMGYKVKTISSSPYDTIKYDDGSKYDDGWAFDVKNMFYHDVSIVITDYDGFGPTTPAYGWLDSLKQALIQFIIPIYSNLTAVTYEAS